MNRFCKICGNEINPATKRCTGCGKQYGKAAYLVLSLVYITLIGMSLYYYHEYNRTLTALLLYDQAVNEAFTERFGGYTNPKTGEYVTGWESYLDALDAQMELENTIY